MIARLLKFEAQAPAATEKRIVRNTIVLSIGEMTTLIAGMLWTIFVARQVGPEIYGFYSLVQATVGILVILVNLGIDKLVMRNVAQQPSASWSYLVTFSLVKVLLSTVILGGYFLYAYANGQASERAEIALIIMVMWGVSALFVTANAVLSAHQAMHYVVTGQMLNAVLTCASGALAIWLKQSFTVVLWLSLGGSTVQLIWAYWFAARFGQFNGRGFRSGLLPFQTTLRLLIDSLPFGALVVASGVNANLMVLLLGQLTTNDSSVGYMAAALRVYSMAIIVPSMLARAVFPAMASTFASSRSGFVELFDRGFRYVTFVTMPTGMGLFVVAPYILNLIYGDAYAPAGKLLQIVALALVSGLGYMTAPALEAMRRQTLSALIYGGIVACNGLVGYWAIPRYGAEGAAWAMVVGPTIGFFVYAAILFPMLRLRYPLAWTLKTFIASLIMAVVAAIVQSQISFLIIIFCIAPATYLVSHLALRTLSLSDWKFLLQLLPEPGQRPFRLWASRRRLNTEKT